MAEQVVTRRNSWLRETLALSRREAVASAVMTGISDNYLSALAIHLRASLAQMGWLSAAPQLAGAIFQLLSVWLCPWFSRQYAIVAGAAIQALAVLGMALVALLHPPQAVSWLIALAVVYHACLNFMQPQWRSWLGGLVPARRRGAFFAGRTRLTMLTSSAVFFAGGGALGLFQRAELAWLGFGLLFLPAAAGRGLSTWFLHRMHDPEPYAAAARTSLGGTLRRVGAAFHDRAFREYSLFFAAVQGAVALSGPFFAVYMLRELEFTYWQFTASTGAAILTQFFTLSAWGYACDHLGNRFAMLLSSILIPIVPALWLVSPDFHYILFVQVMSGIAWGGFTLSTANYLYDLRPPGTDFAGYAAVQSALSALGVFLGALAGGYLSSALPQLAALLPAGWQPEYPIVGLFALSALLRLGIIAWFIPRSRELRVRQRPSLLKVIYRVSRFTPGAGVVLDWLTVVRKK
ncbi:MFS transporter [Haliea sp. E17]|uniref:MFS transporter n=1 Tax=Haliea sp. E17 TaxID=3401576 RepID=UPI003AAD18F2